MLVYIAAVAAAAAAAAAERSAAACNDHDYNNDGERWVAQSALLLLCPQWSAVVVPLPNGQLLLHPHWSACIADRHQV